MKNEKESFANSISTAPQTFESSSSTTLNLAAIEGALPQGFDFYPQGSIKLNPTTDLRQLIHHQPAILFELEGEFKIYLSVWIPDHMDTSVYSEVGNIIAAQLAANLEKLTQVEWMISPPLVLTAEEPARAISPPGTSVLRTYLHQSGEHGVEFQVQVTLNYRGEAGHA